MNRDLQQQYYLVENRQYFLDWIASGIPSSTLVDEIMTQITSNVSKDAIYFDRA